MKRIYLLPLLGLFLCGCQTNETDPQENQSSYDDYGAFLGRFDNNTTGFEKYKYLSIEFEEYDKNTISNLSLNKYVFAYLSVGSLESYRSYYEQFKDITFLDYENWEDERWIDITNSSWQNYIINTLAPSLKNKGAYGIYMDNVDVYSVIKEEMPSKTNAAFSSLKHIITEVDKLGLKIMMNGGSEFIDDLNDQNDQILSKIWAYHQEEVFSLIDDNENNVFKKQNNEDKAYYQQIAKIMKQKGSNVFFLEYTTNQTLINTIKNYCEENQYHYYISSKVNLD